MEVSVKIKTAWPTFLIAASPAGLFCVVLFLAKSLCEAGLIDILMIAIAMNVLFLLLVLYIFQCGTEVAKKALDLQIELEKRKSEDESRAEEDKKCEEAEKEQREHELKLAQLASTIKVEVSNVRLLRT